MRRVLLVLLLVVIVVGVAAYLAYRQQIAIAEARIAGYDATVVDTSFGKVVFAEAGEGEPVLIIHGTGGGFDQSLEMAGTLASDYRVIAPSRFGYLGSDFPDDPTVEMQADAFHEFLEKIGVERAFIIGGSAGTLSAMELAIRHPGRCEALVLLVPAAYAPTRKPNTSGAEGPLLEGIVKAMLGSDFLFWSVLKVLPDQMTQMLLATDPTLVKAAAPREQPRVRAILMNILPVSVRSRGLTFDGQTAGNPQPMELERISCPVLTVSLKDDMFGTSDPAEYIAASVPDGRAVIYPNGGHVWVGHDEEIWREVKAFLAPFGDAQVGP